jgi:acetyl esterase/lipase
VVLLALLATGAAEAQPYPQTARVANMHLWPGVAPGSQNAPAEIKYSVYGNKGHRVFWNIGTPVMAAFYAAKPNGTAVLIIPGGGYQLLYVDSPPVDAAHWLNTLGVDAFVLMHRLPEEHHLKAYNVPMQDAQRAIRLIREGKQLEGRKIDPARIGVMGFSAGGHLAAALGVYYDTKVYDPVDGADGVSARPDFMILGYPALGMPQTLVASVMPNYYRMYQKFSVLSDVSSLSPPAFIVHGDHDSVVPYLLSVRMADALKDAGVPVELHIFPDAGHSFGMGGKGTEAAWPDMCAAWLRARGFIPAN